MVTMRDYTILQRYKYLAAGMAIFLLGVTAFTPLGQTINGARLWLRFGPIQFQVTELMKVLLIIFLAGYLAERGQILERANFDWRSVRLPSLPYVIPLALIGGMVFLMLLLAKDLGAVLILTSLAVALATSAQAGSASSQARLYFSPSTSSSSTTCRSASSTTHATASTAGFIRYATSAGRVIKSSKHFWRSPMAA